MEVAMTDQKPRKWYNSYEFPLIPVWHYRPSNEHNTANASLNWLVFKFWTLDSFEFEIGVACSSHWGIGILGILPYLRWVVAIPFPHSFSMWVQNKLWRRPKTF